MSDAPQASAGRTRAGAETAGESTVAGLLARARRAGVDRLDAQLLLASVLGRSRSWLFAHDDAAVPAPEAARADALLARRAAGEPLAYLVGNKEFHGLRLDVSPAVLVPRPDTELLVDWALELLTAGNGRADRRLRVVDLGTGSGAIALAVKHRHPAAEVLATDANAAALDVARRNADRLGLDLRFAQGDWWQAVGDRRFDLVLANPPYLAAADSHLHALHHEPRQALVAGDDGLAALRRIVGGAAPHVEPGGWVLLEHGFEQADDVIALLHDHGLDDVVTRADLAGHPRCTGGRLRGQTSRGGAASMASTTSKSPHGAGAAA